MAVTCKKNIKLMDDWGDSLGVAYFQNMLQGIAQARFAIFPSNLHYAWDLNGNVIHKYNAPFEERSEVLIADMGDGSLYIIGGASLSSTVQNVWKFNPSIAGYTAGSWTFIGEYVSTIGPKTMGFGHVVDGWFYYGGGWGSNKMWKTQDFVTWVPLNDLPSNLEGISASAFFVFQGKLWVIGGSNTLFETSESLYSGTVEGYVYRYNHENDTWTQIHQDRERFGQIWLDGVATDDYIYIKKGYISADQIFTFPPESNAVFGNNRGLMRSTDGITWEDLTEYDDVNFFFERHRSCGVAVNNSAYFLAGFASNDLWKIE